MSLSGWGGTAPFGPWAISARDRPLFTKPPARSAAEGPCFQGSSASRGAVQKTYVSETPVTRMRVAIYTRVSTDRQSDESQLAELRDYCRRRDWPAATEYRDVMSGARFTRQGLDRLMDDVRRGHLDAIVCFKLDRLGRSLPHLAHLVAELTANGVALVCTSQGIDTSQDNPAGRLQLGVLMAVAEFERSIIQDRVRAGLRAARKNGLTLGRPSTLAAHQEAVRVLLNDGLGVRAIARRLGLPVASTFRLVKAVRRPTDPRLGR